MEQQSHPKQLQGVIVSDRMRETAVVLVSRLQKHRKYGKYVNINKKFKAQNTDNQYKAGENVVIRETRPLSKDKCWEIIARI